MCGATFVWLSWWFVVEANPVSELCWWVSIGWMSWLWVQSLWWFCWWKLWEVSAQSLWVADIPVVNPLSGFCHWLSVWWMSWLWVQSLWGCCWWKLWEVSAQSLWGCLMLLGGWGCGRLGVSCCGNVRCCLVDGCLCPRIAWNRLTGSCCQRCDSWGLGNGGEFSLFCQIILYFYGKGRSYFFVVIAP